MVKKSYPPKVEVDGDIASTVQKQKVINIYGNFISSPGAQSKEWYYFQ